MSAATIVRRQNRVMRAFREAGAVSPAKTATLAALGCRESWATRRLIDRGVLVPCDNGAYYLDEEAAGRFVAWRRKKAMVFLGIAVLTSILLMLLGGPR